MSIKEYSESELRTTVLSLSTDTFTNYQTDASHDRASHKHAEHTN